MEINVLIDEGFEGRLEEGWLKSIAEHVLVAEGTAPNVELSLLITSQEKVKQLNRSYRETDEPTDVLAFSLREEAPGPGPTPFVAPPDGLLHLGEVIISYPQAAIQAAEHGHPVETEISVLAIHGVLHLLGYEHDKPELEHKMRAREKEILDSLNE
jgi:probable rRNA maturation factor